MIKKGKGKREEGKVYKGSSSLSSLFPFPFSLFFFSQQDSFGEESGQQCDKNKNEHEREIIKHISGRDFS